MSRACGTQTFNTHARPVSAARSDSKHKFNGNKE